MVNQEKLLLLLGIPADHLGRPIKHEDVTVIGMKVSPGFNGDAIKQEIENSIKEIGHSPEYIISDQARNLTNGISKSGLQHHLDISHAMGTCLKHSYGNQSDFVVFTTLLGKIRLQYHVSVLLLVKSAKTILYAMSSAMLETAELCLGSKY